MKKEGEKIPKMLDFFMSTLLQLEIFGIYLRTQLLSAISFIMLFRFYKKKKKRYDERVSDLSSGISTISFSHQNGFRRRGRKPHFLYFEEGEEANDVSTCSFKTKRQERCHDHHISKKYMNSIKKIPLHSGGNSVTYPRSIFRV